MILEKDSPWTIITLQTHLLITPSIKSLVTQASSGLSETYNPISSFDWSKERNAANECYSENPYVCTTMIQIDNTMLIVLYMADSLEESKSETNKIVTAMGYQ